MKISARLYANIGVSIGLILVIGSVVLISSRQMTRVLRQEQIIDKIAQGIFELNSLTSDYLLSHSDRALRQWRLRYDSLAALIRSEELRTIRNQTLVAEIQSNHARSNIIFERLRQYHINITGGEGSGNHEVTELEERLTAHFLETMQIFELGVG